MASKEKTSRSCLRSDRESKQQISVQFSSVQYSSRTTTRRMQQRNNRLGLTVTEGRSVLFFPTTTLSLSVSASAYVCVYMNERERGNEFRFYFE